MRRRSTAVSRRHGVALGSGCGALLLLATWVCMVVGASLALPTARAWAQDALQPTAQPARGQLAVALALQEPLGVARLRWPVTTGVPLPPGALRPATAVTIRDAGDARTAGAPAALQSRLLSRWPDGSVRWLLLDWQVDLQPRQQRRFRVERGDAAAVTTPVTLEDKGDTLVVNTGPLQFSVPKTRFAIMDDVRLAGKRVLDGRISSFMHVEGGRLDAQPPTAVTTTDHGPLRVRIEQRGHYGAGFEYVVRIDAFANQPFVRVLHTFEQRGPAPDTDVRQIGIQVPLALAGQPTYRAGRVGRAPFVGRLGEKGFTLFQQDNETVHAGGAGREGRAAGWLNVRDAARGVAVAARFFWQEYPQSFHVRHRQLTYNLWAPEAAPVKVGMGASKTHEMVFYFHGEAEPPSDLLAALTQPLLAHVDPAWTVASGALGNSLVPGPATTPFLRKLDESYRRYQAHAERERWDDSGQVHCPEPARQRPRRGFFGMLNWGDWNFPGYHDNVKGCDAWGNLEYDMAQVLALAYAASGTRAYFEGMTAAARHFMDVDRIGYMRERPEWVGMNHPKNPLHFAFALGGVDLGHTWTEGLLSYFYLTGDERALEAAQGIADYLVRRLAAGISGGNPRQWGWPQIALAAAHEATGREEYKTAARMYARRGMALYPPDSSRHWKMGILAEALSYTHALTQDTQIRDWLLRYAAMVTARPEVVDPRAFPAVAYVGRLSGNDDYADAVTAVVSQLRFGGWGKPFTIAGRLGFRILSLLPMQKGSKDS